MVLEDLAVFTRAGPTLDHVPTAPPLDERAAVRRLLDRFGTGARRGDVDAGAALGFDAALDVLLTRDEPRPATCRRSRHRPR